MMKLLVPITPEEERGWHALRSAILLASRVGGHVDAVFVRGDTAAAASRYESAPEGIHQQAMAALAKEWAQEAEQARGMFADLVLQQGAEIADEPEVTRTPTASWSVAEGTEADAVQRWGSVHDAVVFARAPGRDGAWREHVEGALLGSGRPVLLASYSERRSLGGHVVVGWNRSPQSARAASDALPALRRAERVTILSVTTGAKFGPTAAEAARWLTWHGVAAQVVEVPPAQNGIGTLLLAEANELQADLLVIGAYSHSRFRQAIFGGVTRRVLTHAELPVFMAH